MTKRRLLQERIILPYYKEGEKKWAYPVIKAETIKKTLKQDSEDFTASDDVKPYATAMGAQSYEIQLNSIDPNQKQIFMYLYAKQTKITNTHMPCLFTYYFDDETGAVKPDAQFYDVTITELSDENHKPFDCKLAAISFVNKLE